MQDILDQADQDENDLVCFLLNQRHDDLVIESQFLHLSRALSSFKRKPERKQEVLQIIKLIYLDTYFCSFSQIRTVSIPRGLTYENFVETYCWLD